MAARHYAQFLDASDPDQSADDDWRLLYPPPEILRGSFRIHYIPREDSSYGSPRYLLSVVAPSGHLAFLCESDGAGATNVAVRQDGALLASVGPITFSAGQELTCVFSATDGMLTVSGATTGDGDDNGFSWNVPSNTMRLGGNVQGADVARGYVSLPYAVPGAALGEDTGGGGGGGSAGTLNFTWADSAVLVGAV